MVNQGQPTEAPASMDAHHVDIAIAVSLFGIFSFVYGLFYLANHEKASIQRALWEVVSFTTAIFTAVLWYSALNFGVRMFAADQDLQPLTIIAVDIFHFLFWYAVMHKALVHSVEEMCQNTYDTVAAVRQKRANTRVVGMLSSHIASFAAIEAGLAILALDVFDGVFQILLVFAFAVALYFLFYLTDVFQERVEHHDRLAYYVIEVECDDAENDIGATAISFLLFHAIHSWFVNGWEESEALDNIAALNWQYPVKSLSCGTLIFLIGVVVHLPMIKPKIKRTPKEDIEEFTIMQKHARRAQDTIVHSFSMCFAWFANSAGSWFVAVSLSKFGVHTSSKTPLHTTCLALLTSFFALLAIVFFDHFDHVEPKPNEKQSAYLSFLDTHHVHTLVDGITKILAIVIGFSWEQAFESCMVTIAEKSKQTGPWYPFYVQAGIALVVASVAVPAWRRHIMTHVIDLTEKNNQKSK
eukprot:TRINITY_DN55166_c0_g1_i1.p1 TRINITY_DN55166_c0_g1~~TRINITY_DN55166_c0_g1_i1.p1  ORF type:complete len:468 (+),score=50.10 TRINITY_DN55166_c0_g1_i1:91-1494(+)